MKLEISFDKFDQFAGAPGAVEKMRTVCTRMNHFHLVDGAGHWIQQEQPDRVNELLLAFLESSGMCSA